MLTPVIGVTLVSCRSAHVEPYEVPEQTLRSAHLAEKQQQPCSIGSSQDLLTAFGCRVIYQLVAGAKAPKWADSWETKCDVYLLDCAGDAVPTINSSTLTIDLKRNLNPPDRLLHDAPFLAQMNQFETKLLSSARTPVQIEAKLKRIKLNHGRWKHGEIPQVNFASVLFNQTAADAIKDPHLVTNLNQGIGPTFPPGSIIAKAIWGIFPFSDPSTLMPHKEGFASIIRSDQEDSWSKNDGNSQLLPDPASAARNFAGRTPAWTFPLDGNTHFADECQSEVLPGQLPWNCIFYMSVDASAPSFNLGAGRVIRQDTAAGLTINGNCAKQKQCYVALLGIHFMIRPGDPKSVPPNPDSDWVFMTLWWTGQDNGTGLPPPWKYYQIRATQNFRIDGAMGQTSNVCFNPYLEGINKGEASNCVNCHYYAAFNRLPGQGPSNLTSVGTTKGFLPPGLTQRVSKPRGSCATNADYGDGYNVVCTDFVWSLTALSDPAIVRLRPAEE
jgi:hypothetical protein